MLKISIVTVTFNAEAIIGRTLDSIISQDYGNKEFLIIDGLSNDNTVRIVNSFRSQIDIFVSEEDSGIYEAMNKGINLASGDFVIFMNAGDFFYSNCTISNFVNLVSDRHAIYYGNAIYFVKDKNIEYERGGLFDRFRIAKTNICHQTIFYPRTVYRTEKYNMNYRLFADWEYNMRCFKQGRRFVYINEKIAYYDHTGISLSQTDLNFEKDFKTIVFKSLGILPVIYLFLRKFYKKILN